MNEWVGEEDHFFIEMEKIDGDNHRRRIIPRLITRSSPGPSSNTIKISKNHGVPINSP